MARNTVQFQKGLGMAEFQRLYGTEEQCHATPRRARCDALAGRFACPDCGERRHSYCRPKRLSSVERAGCRRRCVPARFSINRGRH